jgi:hypothetical protein
LRHIASKSLKFSKESGEVKFIRMFRMGVSVNAVQRVEMVVKVCGGIGHGLTLQYVLNLWIVEQFIVWRTEVDEIRAE